MEPLLAEAAIADIDVLAIQEPPYTHSSVNPGEHFHLYFEGDKGTRTCFYVNKRLDVDSWDVTYQGGNLCSLHITREGQGDSDIWIHNIYNPPPVNRQGPSTIPALNNVLVHPREHLAVGDFNLHHYKWNAEGRQTHHKEADTLLDVTTDKRMSLLNPKGTITWRERGSETTIDLAFGSRGVAGAVTSCSTREDLRHGSDHIPVQTTLDWAYDETPSPAPRRAWKTVDSDNVTAKARAVASQIPLGTLTTADQIDSFVGEIMAALDEVIKETVPMEKPSKRAKTYWNEACTKATDTAKKCCRANILDASGSSSCCLHKC